MMDTQDQLALAHLGLSLAAIAFVWIYMRRQTKVDEYRETLFTLRDELFDYMWQNNLSFDLPAYRLVRKRLNSSIQVARIITPLTCMVVVLFFRNSGPLRLTEEIAQIPGEAHQRHFRDMRKAEIEAFLVFLGPTGRLIKTFVVQLEPFARRVQQRVGDSLAALASVAPPRQTESVKARLAR